MIKFGHLILGHTRRFTGIVRSTWSRRDGIAALEFALLMPIMVYTLFAAFDLANALSVTRRMTNAADVIAELVSQQLASGKPTGSVNSPITNGEILADFASILTTLPDVMGDAAAQNKNWTNDVQAIVSSIEFGPLDTCVVPTPPSTTAPVCSEAYVMWSVGFSNTTFPQTRTCGPISISSLNTYDPSLTSVPPGTATAGVPGTPVIPGSVIAVDLTYVYRPTFTYWLTGPFTFQRTAYIQPRFFTLLSYSPPSGVTPTQVGSSSNYSSSGMSSCQYSGSVPSS